MKILGLMMAAGSRKSGLISNQRLNAVLLITVVALLLTACGFGGNKPEAAEPEATEAPSALESPLNSQFESPLSALESPLALPAAVQALLDEPIPEPSITPNAGKGIIYGRLISSVTEEPVSHMVVRLPKVICHTDQEKLENCEWALNNAYSPSATTDDDGYFVFENVDAVEMDEDDETVIKREARDYVIFVGDFMMVYQVIMDKENPKQPKVYRLHNGETIGVGSIVIDF